MVPTPVSLTISKTAVAIEPVPPERKHRLPTMALWNLLEALVIVTEALVVTASVIWHGVTPPCE